MEKFAVENPKTLQQTELASVRQQLSTLKAFKEGLDLTKEASEDIARLETRERELVDAIGT